MVYFRLFVNVSVRVWRERGCALAMHTASDPLGSGLPSNYAMICGTFDYRCFPSFGDMIETQPNLGVWVWMCVHPERIRLLRKLQGHWQIRNGANMWRWMLPVHEPVLDSTTVTLDILTCRHWEEGNKKKDKHIEHIEAIHYSSCLLPYHQCQMIHVQRHRLYPYFLSSMD